jgi:hypothetical protein
MSSIILEILSGVLSAFEYMLEIQQSINKKVTEYMLSGSFFRNCAKILTIVFYVVWNIYLYYIFASDIYNKGILYAIDNQFHINRYFTPFVLLITFFTVVYPRTNLFASS